MSHSGEIQRLHFELKRINVRLDQLSAVNKSLAEKVRNLEAKNLYVPAAAEPQAVPTGVSGAVPELKP